jgi:hypothetical protein
MSEHGAVGTRKPPAWRLAEIEAREEARGDAIRSYELWRELDRIARRHGWDAVIRLLEELEVQIPNPEDV